MLYIFLYKSSSVKILNPVNGVKIFIDVRQLRLALYINPVSPSKETLLFPTSTADAPNCLNSFVSNSSKPNNVLASILKFFAIVKNPIATKIQYFCRAIKKLWQKNRIIGTHRGLTRPIITFSTEIG